MIKKTLKSVVISAFFMAGGVPHIIATTQEQAKKILLNQMKDANKSLQELKNDLTILPQYIGNLITILTSAGARAPVANYSKIMLEINPNLKIFKVNVIDASNKIIPFIDSLLSDSIAYAPSCVSGIKNKAFNLVTSLDTNMSQLKTLCSNFKTKLKTDMSGFSGELQDQISYQLIAFQNTIQRISEPLPAEVKTLTTLINDSSLHD